MEISKKKISNINILIILLLILASLSYVAINKFQKNKDQVLALEPISINLLTSVHPDLSWNFRPVEPKIVVKPGEVTTVEYIVENLGNINCFCYDARTLKPKQKSKYTLVLLIDPEVTKDSKTKDVKEVTIQFTFFDYEEYKKKES